MKEGKMKIKAAVIREKSGPFKIEEIELDEPRNDEVVVRIVGVGICHTDLAGRDGHLPIPPPPSVFGHEGQIGRSRGIGLGLLWDMHPMQVGL
jgi:aryl-alcohol dehydrogenase